MRTCGYLMREQAEKIPDRDLLRFEDATVSYGAYNAGVNRYANLLRARGVQRGEAVAIMMENSPAHADGRRCDGEERHHRRA